MSASQPVNFALVLMGSRGPINSTSQQEKFSIFRLSGLDEDQIFALTILYFIAFSIFFY